MQDLLIFPYNGNGLEALDCLEGEYNFIGFVDDMKEKQGAVDQNYPVLDRAAFSKYPSARILAVPGSPVSFKYRKEIIDSLKIDEHRFITLIHSTAKIGKNVKIGRNCLILAGVVITSNAILGDNICILPNTVIHHDSKIGNHTLIGSNCCIAGFTEIGNNCYIGSGSNIINGIEIGDNVLVGMGSNVIKSISDNSKVVGNPARSL